MTTRLLNAVHETTQTSGALGPSNAITLLGAEPGKQTFDSQLSNGEVVKVTVVDTISGDEEIMLATFTSPDTLTPLATREWSTDGGLGGSAITWPSSGTRDVLVAMDAYPLEDLTDPADQGTGILVRTADHIYTPRSVATDDALRLPITNGSGVAGNPTVSGSWLAAHVLDRAASAAAGVRTMAERLIHAAGEVVIQMVTSVFEFWNDDAGTDKIARFTRTGANDYRFDVNDGGSWLRGVTVTAPAGAGDAEKTLRLTAAGTAFEKGAVLPTPSGGDAGKIVIVNSVEDGYEPSSYEPIFERIDKKSADDTKRLDGTEYLVGSLSNLSMPGGAGDGTRKVLVEFGVSVVEDGSDAGTIQLRLRMGTNGTTADASVWSSAYAFTAGQTRDFIVSALITIPTSATKLSLTSQRTSGASQYTVKGQSETATLRNSGLATAPGAFLRARTVAPVS